MTIDVQTTALPGVILLKPKRYGDARGYFLETYHQRKYRDLGITSEFVQDNLSSSAHGVLRGLHYQIRHQQAKLVQCVQGCVFDVAIDIRIGSPSFGKWFGVELSDQNGLQMFVPTGFAHGFCVLSDAATFHYKCSDFYHPNAEGGILWSDPALGIQWPLEKPILSDKDGRYPCLDQISKEQLPKFKGSE